MGSLSNLFNEIQRNNNINAARVRPEDLEGAYVFGEENRNYETYFEEQDKLGRTRVKGQFEHVGTLARSITSQLYAGDPKYTSYIQGIYQELYQARVKQGFPGLTGFNMKGVICVILYLIVKRDERKQLSLDDLVKAANKVLSGGVVKVTVKMLSKYINIITSLVPSLSVKNDNDNGNASKNDDVVQSTLAHMRRMSLTIQMSAQTRAAMNKRYERLPTDLKYDHNPVTVAKAVVYLFALKKNKDVKNASKYQQDLEEKLGMSKYILKQVVVKYRPHV